MLDQEQIDQAVQEVIKHSQLEAKLFFPTVVYTIDKPEYVEKVKEVGEESLTRIKQKQELNDIYPAYMSENIFDTRINDFLEFVGSTGWNILSEQGYAMDNFNTSFESMWVQEHHKHSAMEQHIHNNGIQLVGFYFLDVPENSSRLVFHDPRAGKVQINLPEFDVSNLTPASIATNIVPKSGLLVFAPSWLPHSFTRHASDEPIKFVHFNMIVQHAVRNVCTTSAEIV
jgi:uncharacterized protein (TIGR02466 family)